MLILILSHTHISHTRTHRHTHKDTHTHSHTHKVYKHECVYFPTSCIVEYESPICRVIVVLETSPHAHQHARRHVENARVIVPELEHRGAIQSLENGVYVASICAHREVIDGETTKARQLCVCGGVREERVGG